MVDAPPMPERKGPWDDPGYGDPKRCTCGSCKDKRALRKMKAYAEELEEELDLVSQQRDMVVVEENERLKNLLDTIFQGK